MSHLMNTYARLPVAFTHGKGAWLTDEHGQEYLDALAGIAVNGLGHAHPKLTAALAEQVGRLIQIGHWGSRDRCSTSRKVLLRPEFHARMEPFSAIEPQWANCVLSTRTCR